MHKRNFILPTQNLKALVEPITVCGSINCPSNLACYEPDPMRPIVECQSLCHQNYCQNNGVCEHINVSNPPKCFCQVSHNWYILTFSTAVILNISKDADRLWYFGRQCERMLWDWELYLIIVAVGIIFILLIVAILCLICRQSCHRSFGKYRTNVT